MANIDLPSRQYRAALLALALLGIVFILITTSRYGAGVSSDAVRAMSTAEGLLEGRGFMDFTGTPYVLWPPLYPLVLAGISLVTRLDIFHAAWYLNLVLFPVNIWLWGLLFERIFGERRIYALAASAAAVLSSSMIRIYANVASDPLFITFMVLLFLAAADYLEKGSFRSLVWMFVWAALGCLQRYPGVALLGIAGLVVLVKRGWKGIPVVLFGGILAALPLGVWLIGHNLLGYGTLFGTRAYDEMRPLENISLSLTKVLHWFLPYAPGLREVLLRPWIILLAVAALLVVLNLRKDRWVEWGRALASARVWPVLCFSAAYYLMMAYTVNTIDHRDLTSDRYYIILFPAILLFLLLTWQELVAPHIAQGKALRVAAGVALLLWFVYPLYDLQEYLRLARTNGEPSNYNIYNSSHFTELEVLKEGRRLAQQHPEATLYSNYVNLLWFQYKRPIHVLLPVDNSQPPEERVKHLREAYPGWPGDEPGYLIWFTPNEYKYLAGPGDLGRIANLTLLYRDDFGEIYEVRPK